MAPQIRKAERRKAKLRLALIGPTGSGKTFSALKLAFGIGKKIGLIDTENGSGDLYAHLGEYDIITLEAPYTVAKYREAIKAFENAGHDVIIIDSLSHAWAGSGGLLDKQGRLESSGKYRNSFATWREITPEHNSLVEEMLRSPSHIVATVRAKTEYVLDKDDKGRQVPRKIGLSPVQRDGLEYEFSVVMDVSENHYAVASKDRTSMFAGWSDQISERTGEMLLKWLETGSEPEKAKPQPAEAQQAPSEKAAPANGFLFTFDGLKMENVPAGEVKARCLGFIKGNERDPELLDQWKERNTLVLRQFWGVNRPAAHAIKSALAKATEAAKQTEAA